VHRGIRVKQSWEECKHFLSAEAPCAGPLIGKHTPIHRLEMKFTLHHVLKMIVGDSKVKKCNERTQNYHFYEIIIIGKGLLFYTIYIIQYFGK